MDRIKLSAYVIAYNEEEKIRECLESVKWADEIIFMDSFSTDRTAEIAKEYTDKVYQHKFDGFGRLRNEALERCSNDWVLSVDADERVTPELKSEILSLLEKGPNADAYLVPRKSHFLGRWIRHCGWYPDFRQPQFFNRRKMKYTSQMVHETYELDGRLSRVKEHVLQYPFLTLDQFFKKMDRYSTLRSSEMKKEGRKFSVLSLILNPPAMFARMYITKLGFLDGAAGLVLSMLYAYYTAVKYIKLWEQNVKS
ncbi:MAG: glycosyltransferase family 2 protein [Elusimicrobiota bacterium]